jgi:hypothetical protein
VDSVAATPKLDEAGITDYIATTERQRHELGLSEPLEWAIAQIADLKDEWIYDVQRMPIRKILEEIRWIRIRGNGLSRRRIAEAQEAEEDQYSDDSPAFQAQVQASIDRLREQAANKE